MPRRERPFVLLPFFTVPSYACDGGLAKAWHHSYQQLDPTSKALLQRRPKG